MIPITLKLENFLSYREMPEPLDLGGVHIACLSGANGNGKSALLDAITWVLWGKARGSEGGQEQERLIRDGADEARVEMTFELDGQTYRVVRARTRKGKGDLALHVAGEGGTWTDMGAESVTGTQAVITNLLRMDYEVFTKSAYILQGRADEFSTLEPSKRKDVLAKILGLEIYERLADRAKENKKEHAGLAEALRADAERYEAELLAVSDLEAARAGAEQRAADAETQRAAAQSAWEQAQKALAEVTAVEDEVRRLEAHKESLEATLQRTLDELAATAHELTEAERAATVDDETRALAARVPELGQHATQMEEARARTQELNAEIADLERRVAVERERLTGERRAAAVTIEEARRDVQAIAAAEPLLAQAREALVVLDAAVTEREQLLERHKELVHAKAKEESEGEARATARAELRERAERLRGADAECPICEQPLTKEHRSKIAAETKARLDDLAAADAASKKTLKAVQKEMDDVTARGLEIKKQLARRDEIAGRAAQLEQTIARRVDLELRLSAAEARANEIDALLTAGADSPTEREKLASVIAERDEVAYDDEAHALVRNHLEAARRAHASMQVAAQAGVHVESLRRTLDAARTREGETKEALAETIRHVTERSAVLVDLPERRAAEARARATLDALQQSIVDHRTAAARAHEQLEALGRVAARAKEMREQHAAARTLAGRYEKLAKVFGRDGIPARIIGNAIPELQREANELLDLLTAGRLHVTLALTRPTKSKTIKETLDITVSDTNGIRAYEMYSGGEKLRIDFALRIALSRLLARRANTRLETLVIDEGFGSQDAEGQVALVDAIMRVRDSFRRILVITHLEDLKEHFDVRILVDKDPARGSRLRVVWAGAGEEPAFRP